MNPVLRPLASALLAAHLAGCATKPPPPPPAAPSQVEAAAAARAFAGGDLDTAEERYRLALKKARAEGDAFQAAAVMYNLSGCLLARGKAAEARVMLDQLDPARFPRARLHDLALLNARVDLALLRLPQAEKSLLDLPAGDSVLITLAELRLAQDRPEDALAAARAIGAGLADREDLLGRIAARKGEHDEAARRFTAAAEGYRRERRPRDAARAQDGAGVASAELGQPKEAAEFLLLAAQTWHGLGEPGRARDSLALALNQSAAAGDDRLLARVKAFAFEMKDALPEGGTPSD